MSIGKVVSSAPSVLLIILGVTALFMWSSKSNLEWAIDDLIIREIQLSIQNEQGEHLKEASVSVEPMYSFDEIKPKHTLTILGDGKARLSVVFVRHFKLHVGAVGYKTETIEFNDSDASELRTILKPR